MAARDPEYRSIVEALVRGRKTAGLTQMELANRLGKLQSYVSKIELCERRLDVVEFAHYATALGLDPCTVLRNALRNSK